MAAMVGLATARRVKPRGPASPLASAASASRSLRSAPAQKTSSPPVRTPTFAWGSRSKSSQASRRARAVRESIALRASGRLSRRMRTGPSEVTRRGPSALTLQHRLAHDLFDRDHAVADLLEAAAAQGDHAVLDRLLAQLEGAGTGEDHLPHFVLDLQHLVERYATFVAGVAAALAAAAAEKLEGARLVLGEADLGERRRRHLERLLAEAADAAHQPLGRDHVHRGGHQEGLDAHVHQAAD